MSELSDTQRRNVDQLGEGIEAYRRGDMAGVLEFLDEDVEGYLPSELPNSGTFRGHDGYLAWTNRWLEAWEDFTIGVSRVEPVGERHVVAVIRQSGTGRGSGIPVEMEIAYMFEIRDGKGAAVHLYPTLEQAVAVAEERERDAPH